MEEAALVRGHLRWGDLLSPKAMYTYTISDAWFALPTLLAMGGTLLGGLLLFYLIKKGLEHIILRGELPKKWVLQQCERTKDGTKITRRKWVQVPYCWFGSAKHLFLETLFFFFVVILCIFCASIGNVNLVESPIALALIGTIFAYIFGSGLSQVGAAYFIFLMNSMSVNEWWSICGTPQQGGRVWRITPFFIEFLRVDEESLGAVFVRVPMTSVMGEKWERNIYKEQNSPIVEMDQEELDAKPKRAVPVSNPEFPGKTGRVATTDTAPAASSYVYDVYGTADDNKLA